jgi:hypothetical protein
MMISLFWRMTLGYAAVLLLSVGASIYAIVQLGGLSRTARQALDGDYRTIGQQEALTDAFLSEVRYGGKYLLNQSPSSFEQFRQFRKDVLRFLGELKNARFGAESSTQLARIEHLHQSFNELFEQEARYIKSNQPYAQSRYQQEREKILDNTLRELARLKDQLEKALHDKLEHVDGTARDARTIAIVTALILLIAGSALSLKMSTAVTEPLAELTGRLRSESAGRAVAVQTSNIPEIQELSELLIQRQQGILQAARSHAAEIERATEKLTARAASLKRQLNELRVQTESVMPAQGRESVDALIGEVDRLIQHCAELNISAAARTEIMNLPPQPSPATVSAPTGAPASDWIMRELPDATPAQPSSAEPAWLPGGNLLGSLINRVRRWKGDTAR